MYMSESLPARNPYQQPACYTCRRVHHWVLRRYYGSDAVMYVVYLIVNKLSKIEKWKNRRGGGHT